MNTNLPTHKIRLAMRRLQPLIRIIISLLVAFIAGLFLFGNSLFSQLMGTIIAIGLDTQRAQFITALIMILGTALIGSALGRSKLGAIIGASIVFYLNYLNPFIQHELQPVYDPGKHLEPLDSGALVRAAIIILSLALLSAFFGAAGGTALGETLLNPFYQSGQLIWRRLRKQRSATEPEAQEWKGRKPNRIVRGIFNWSGAVLLVVLLVLASQSGPLFIFSPNVGVHTAPKVKRVQNNGQPLTGTLVEDSLISPALKNQRKTVVVYLPPSYNTAEGKGKHYPVLYLLHGAPGGPHDWFTGGKIGESVNTLMNTELIPELILVSPDGNGRIGETSEWGNSFDKQQLIETYVAVDVVEYVEQHYRAIPDTAHRAIGGLSMGGFGATNIAVHHPDVFGSVISLGGYYNAEGTIWGNDPTYMKQNSPTDLLPHDPQAWKLHFYLGAATTDQPYYNYTRQFIGVLSTLHISYKQDIQEGRHSWRVWQVQMYNALLWLKWE